VDLAIKNNSRYQSSHHVIDLYKFNTAYILICILSFIVRRSRVNKCYHDRIDRLIVSYRISMDSSDRS
jgi:hypothetical protein